MKVQSGSRGIGPPFL